jgi:hypothetical protein
MPISENRDIPCLPYTFKTVFTSCYPSYNMLLISHYPDTLKCELTKRTASPQILNRKKLYSFNDVIKSFTEQGNQNRNKHMAGMWDLRLVQWWLWRIWDVILCSLVEVQWPFGGTYSLFFFYYWWGGTKSLGIVATSGLLYKPQMRDEDECEAIGGIKIGRGNRSTQRKPAPAPLCPPQIPHDQTRARTRAATVGNQELTYSLHHRSEDKWRLQVVSSIHNEDYTAMWP